MVDERKITSLVSIIVPCYNQAKYLSYALDSVLAQTYNNWECIIVDDGSEDNTETISQQYCIKDSRFLYIKQNNQGLAHTRNNGIRHSHGTYILPLDADDKIGEKYLELAVKRFVDFPETKLIYCKAEKFGTINEKWNLAPYSFENLLWENMIFCSALYKKKDYDNTLGYNPNMLYGYEDWDFWLSLLHPNDTVVQLEETLFFYRQHVSSMIHNAGEHQNELLSQLVNNHKELYLPYLNNIIIYRKKQEELVNAYKLLSNTLSSEEYRIGKMIKKRFKFLAKILINIGNYSSVNRK